MAKSKKPAVIEAPAVEVKPTAAELSGKLAAMLNQPAVVASDAKAPEKKTTKSSVFTGTMFILDGKAQLEIKCYNAAEADKVERNNLHATHKEKKMVDGVEVLVDVPCLGKVKNGSRSCSKCNDAILGDDQVTKGVEVSKGKFVTLTDDEVAKLKPIKDNEMYVTEYVTPESVDLTYIEDSEFVCIDPDSKTPRTEIYLGFVKGMIRSNRYAKGVRVKSGREQYFVVRPYTKGDKVGMILHHLFAEYEVRDCNKMTTDEAVSTDFVETIAAYMEASTVDFAPAKYDSFLGNVRNLIQAKANDKTLEAVTPKSAPAPAVDLMADLKASLTELKAKGKAAGK
jgi:DNA end-binding protein Ku